jgi:hypothetical protein
VACNKLFVIEHKQQQEGEKKSEVLVTPSGAKLAPGEVEFLPYWWPDSRTTALQERLKEIFGEVDASMASMSRADVLCKIKSMAENVGEQKSYFRRLELTADAKWQIDQSNATSKKAAQGQPFVYSHLQSGFLGATYHLAAGAKVMTQDDLARFWAYCRHAAHLVDLEMRAARP